MHPASGTRIDRASPNDVTILATDRGAAPMNIGAVLVLETDPKRSPPDIAWLRGLLSARIPVVPRFRHRLVATPPGCGRPVWVDDPDFVLDRHLSAYDLDRWGTENILQVAAEVLCSRLDRGRPLWRACLVTGPEPGQAALVLVIHHVLADGLAGLAVLAALADGLGMTDPGPFPQAWPRRRELARDAVRARLSALSTLPRALQRGAQGLAELGLGGQRPTLAERISLNRPTGRRRRLTTVTVPLDPVSEAAHHHGATVNDIVLTAVTGALATLLERRGERPHQLVVSVPISARRSAAVTRLGNETGVVPVAVPAVSDDHARLRAVVALTHDAPRHQRASSAGPLGLVFRALARLGLFQAVVDHQRLVHTFETNVRGPRESLELGGHRVAQIVPLAVNPGNVGVSFGVLSYAGQLVVTVVADPLIVPDQDLLTTSLRRILGDLVAD